MCQSCQAVMINGHYCHETGCPDSHLDASGNPYKVKCEWCGQMFTPEDKGQTFCDESCAESYRS